MFYERVAYCSARHLLYTVFIFSASLCLPSPLALRTSLPREQTGASLQQREHGHWPRVRVGTTSEQLKIINARGGVKPNTKTFNQGLVVEYMDRAQGPTVDFFSQNLRGTHTHLAKSH